jgi:hypothetical protein
MTKREMSISENKKDAMVFGEPSEKVIKAYRATFAVRPLPDDDFLPFLLAEINDYLYNCGEVECEKASSQIARFLEDYATGMPKKEAEEEEPVGE